MPYTSQTESFGSRQVYSGKAGWRIFLPRLTLGGDLVLPQRYDSFENLKFSGKSLRFLSKRGSYEAIHNWRIQFCSWLKTNLGLKPKLAFILSRRSVSDLRRIEEEIKGIVDSLLLFDTWFFLDDPSVSTGLKRIFRSVLAISTFNVDLVTKFWKEFSSFVYTNTCKLQTISNTNLSKGNPFRRLVDFTYIGDLCKSGLSDKLQCQALSHLTSTRQLVAGGVAVLKKSLRDFRENTSSMFNIDKENLGTIYKMAFKVGRKVMALGASLPDETGHISLNSAGSYDTSLKEGGRAHEIAQRVREILTYCPEDDEVITLPFVTLRCRADSPRWMNWFRTDDEIDDLLDSLMVDGDIVTFGHPNPYLERLGIQDRLWGFDHALGNQILCCAYLDSRRDTFVDPDTFRIISPIPARVLVVPEPGGKSRIVTTSPWWNVILQQPSGHVLKELLKAHPSASSSLKRSDQAWEYLNILRKASGGLSSFTFLSSDLKEATDSIPLEVAKQLLYGFIDGVGLKSHLVNLGIELLCSPRRLETLDEVWVSCRGIMMGEPLTKVTLTLLNLVVEEEACRYYTDTPEGPITLSWRAYHIGGDDHIAYGPKEYLDRITYNHLRWGSKISPEKHGTSSIAVKYCEKFLFVLDFQNSSKSKFVTNENYLSHVFTDSVKIRLLAPIGKSIDVQNDRNIAIGKAIQLSKTLHWLPTTFFPLRWKVMVRQRFIRRMKSYLPEEGSKLMYQLYLPYQYGGLGLYLTEDLEDLFNGIPGVTKKLLLCRARRTHDHPKEIYESLKLIRRFPSNEVARGMDLKGTFRELIDLWLETIKDKYLQIYPFGELKTRPEIRKFEGDTMVALRNLGFSSLTELTSMMERCYVFSELLRGEKSLKVYNTSRWDKRWYNLYDRLAFLLCFEVEGGDALTFDEFKSVLDWRAEYQFVDLNQKVLVLDKTYGFINSIPLKEEIEFMAPSLKISKKLIANL